MRRISWHNPCITAEPEWYISLPLFPPETNADGTNIEGVSWDEWYAAARFTGKTPRSLLERSWWVHAWECGVDPTEMGGS